MGLTAENVAEKYGITREECDKIAVRSHNLACKAIDEGIFKDEIVPVVIKSKKGEKVITDDEHPIRGCTMETLAKLKPAFKKDGVITAANASGHQRRCCSSHPDELGKVPGTGQEAHG